MLQKYAIICLSRLHLMTHFTGVGDEMCGDDREAQS